MSLHGASPASVRLQELGLSLPLVAAPVASYIPAIRIGNLVWTSGQLPFVDGALEILGQVCPADADGAEGQVSAAVAQALARVAALNALSAVAAELPNGIDGIVRIVKITGFVASSPGFTGQPTVVNGASELMGEIFGDRGLHARSAVGVTVLPLNSPVEIELIVEVEASAHHVP